MIICPVCETENEAHEEFCILCGAKLHQQIEVFPTTTSFTSEIESALDDLLPLPEELPEEAPSTSPNQPTLAHQEEINLAYSQPNLPQPFGGGRPMATRSPEMGAPFDAEIDHDDHDLSTQHFRPTAPTVAPPQARPQSYNTEIPAPGTLCLIVYFQRRPALYFPVIYDELLIGRTDPASNAYPDLDLTPFDPDLAISRKHTYIYREQGAYFIYPISNSGTQVNQEMVDIGTKKLLKEGDVIILSGRLAIRFARS
ncbi:MAG: FHA domain-containing protein [Myxococcales bacterium]|nr:FHA domain-containing protein [Myxococcales bacterium]